MEPRIETAEIQLAGVQAIIHVGGSFVQDLEALYGRLLTRLDDIPDISPQRRTFGYWQFVDQETRVYFCGVQVASLARFKWDHAYGLAAWSLGETTWAIWQEKDGEEGTIVHGGVCWEWMNGSNYTFDSRFLGDFEVTYWEALGKTTKGEYHEIWIPVVKGTKSSRPTKDIA